MTQYYDIRIASGLTNSLSRGSFSEFMERETGYSWDGTIEGKLWLMLQIVENEITEKEQFILEVENMLIPILAEMEMQGVVVDTAKLAEIGEQIKEKIKLCEVEIFQLTGEFFNLNSPKQVAEILFWKLGIKPTKKNKTGFSVDTEVLEEIAKEYDVARLIIEHRTLSKLQSTYVESLIKVADKKTHRIHTTYGQLGAATGRMSSNDPNLQNIPTGKGYANEIKSCFIPTGENIFLVADYSQIEIRVLAWLSQDKALLDAFEKGEDIHTRTAKFLFPESSRHSERNEESRNLDVSQAQHDGQTDWRPSSDQRRIAKTVNFWVIYGITGFGLSKTLGTPPWEASQYIEAFYDKYPWVRTYYDSILAHGRTKGYVETAFWRRRYIPGLNDANKMARSIAEREAINMPIQGTAADMLKIAMIDINAKVRDKKLTGRMILQVHDELVFDIPKEECEIWEDLVRTSLENILIDHSEMHWLGSYTYPPIRVDVHTGKNWVLAKG